VNYLVSCHPWVSYVVETLGQFGLHQIPEMCHVFWLTKPLGLVGNVVGLEEFLPKIAVVLV
jgi:hypothetical protein